ncbi:DUF4157 domain-containing protein [Streptomyces sp. NPDC005474]|uniref:DUF4157 domain-containing protein n=1 Tax=Streptomyces sp. NPDC005474 TaxID=3154878 RepID=UPI003456A62A
MRADLFAVRVHTGPAADRLARGLGAEAFAGGSHVFLPARCLSATDSPGRRKDGRQAAPVSTIPLNGEASESRPDASGRARRGSSRGAGPCGGQGSWRRSVRCCWSFAGPRG